MIAKRELKLRIQEALEPLGFSPLKRGDTYDLALDVSEDFRLLFASDINRKASYIQLDPTMGLECVPITPMVAPQVRGSYHSI